MFVTSSYTLTPRHTIMSVNCLSLFPTTHKSLFTQIKAKLNVSQTHFPYSCKFTCALHVGFDDIAAITHNKVLIAAGVSAAVGQLSKPFSGVLLYGRSFNIGAIIQAGGFPSTHSSAVVATATCLALERGFGDSIFGLSVVYACLFMYDAQGVRREVGIHAKALNKLLLEQQIRSVTGSKDMFDSVPGKSFKSSSILEESNASLNEKSTATRLLNSMKNTTEGELTSSDSAASGKESERAPNIPLLKESIGHTVAEVMAGGFLGLLVALAVNIIL